MPRLFVAIDFSPEIKLSLCRLCISVPGTRRVAAGNFRLTLRVVGEVDDRTAAAIGLALRQVGAPRFWLTLAGVGQFGGHTLWVGVERNTALLRLQNTIENKLQGVAPAADARPYKSHVKLGYSRRRSCRPFLTDPAGFRTDPFEVTEFSLIENRLGKSGAIYERRADYALLASDEPAPSRIDHPCVGTGEPASAGGPR